jgi:glucokinase
MYYLGIDLGGSNIAIGLVDEDLKIVLKDKVPTGASRRTSDIMDDMAALCERLVNDCNLTFDDIEYAGIASPGSIDPENQVVHYANNLPMTEFAIGNELKARIPLKRVYLENDANAAALAEAKAGAGKGCQNLVMITLGTGVGGGVVINGKLYSGFNYTGAELGHTVIEFNGKPCSCGRKGCFEAYCSATGLKNLTKEKLQETKDTVMWDMIKSDLENVSGRTAFDAAKQNDQAGLEVVDKYINYLACGITNMVNIFQPEVLCIGGGVCGEGDYLLIPLVKLVERDQYGFEHQTKPCQIKIAELGNDAGIIGAAVLGL